MSLDRLLRMANILLLAVGLPVILIFGSGGLLDTSDIGDLTEKKRTRVGELKKEIRFLENEIKLLTTSLAYRRAILRSVGVFEKGESLVVFENPQNPGPSIQPNPGAPDESEFPWPWILASSLLILSVLGYRKFKSAR